MLTPLEWADIYVHGKLKSDTYKYIISNKLISANNICIFIIKSVNLNPFITIYGHCIHSNCENFTLRFKSMKNKEILVSVFSNDINYCHGPSPLNRLIKENKPTVFRATDINESLNISIQQIIFHIFSRRTLQCADYKSRTN